MGAIAEASQPQRKIVERPDRKAVEQSVAAASEEIKSLQGRIQAIKVQLEGSRATKLWQSPELVEARNKLSVMSAAFADHVEERRQMRAEVDVGLERQREQSRVDARGARERMSLEQIDGEIQRLEYQMQHTSMAMKEEKGLLQQIKELKKSRELAKDSASRLQQISQEQELRGEKLREKDQLLSGLKVAMGEQKKEIDAIRERLAAKETARMQETSALAMERNAAYDRMKALRESINTQWSEFKEKQSEFFAREKALREKRAIAARALEEKRYAEWQERERRKKENFVEKFTEEIILCEQLEAYLQKLTPVVEKISSEESSSSREKEVPTVEGFGMVLMSKKNRSEEESWFSGKSKAKKGKSQAPRKEKLSLSLDALSSFSKIGVAAPSSTADITKVLEDLKAKKEEFVKLQAEAKAEREKLEVEEALKQGIAQKSIENVNVDETVVAAA